MASNRTGIYSYKAYGSRYGRRAAPIKDKSKREQRRKILTAILVTLSSLFLFLIIMVNSVYLSVFNDTDIHNYMCNDKNYQMVFDNVYRDVEDLATTNGINMECVVDCINASYIATDMNVFANNQDGIIDEFDFESRREEIKENIIRDFRARRVKITPELEKKIDEFIDQVYVIYQNNINLNLWIEFLRFRFHVRNYTVYIHTALVGTFVLLAGFMVYKNKKYIHRAYRALCNVFWAAGVASLISGATIFLTGIYRNIVLTPRHFTYVIAGLGNELCKTIIMLSLFSLLIGGLFLYLTERSRAALIRKYSKRSKSKPSFEHHQNIIDFIENNNPDGNN